MVSRSRRFKPRGLRDSAFRRRFRVASAAEADIEHALPGRAIEAERAAAGPAREQAVERDADAFATELADDPGLAELASVPLLLSVMIYLRLTGRVLPHSRLEALEELVGALIVDQPSSLSDLGMPFFGERMRRRWCRQAAK